MSFPLFTPKTLFLCRQMISQLDWPLVYWRKLFPNNLFNNHYSAVFAKVALLTHTFVTRNLIVAHIILSFELAHSKGHTFSRIPSTLCHWSCRLQTKTSVDSSIYSFRIDWLLILLAIFLATIRLLCSKNNLWLFVWSCKKLM